MKRTKREQSIIDAYKFAKYRSIQELYAKPSFYKTRAEALIIQEMHNQGGADYRVIGGNCHQFSCAYLVCKDWDYYLIYHTASNIYKILLDGMGEVASL